MSKALDPKDTCVLVTGGAGFIGSHTVVQLLEGGYQVVIVDDLSNSSAVAVDRVKTIVGDEAAKNLTFYEANVLDRDAMNKIFDTHQIDRVIHFAGFKAVGESVSKPVEYYHNNIENTLVLIDVMRNHGCKSIIFSSSSTVYGDPDNPPVTEEDPKKPATNPYGWTKWMIEQILMDVHTADPEWDVVLLRYFNPIGAHPSGLIGEDPKGIPNNLVPYVAQVAVDHYAWLKHGEMLDGLALAETTPGPLVLVLSYVGFLAGFRESGGLDPLIGGLLGGLIAAWATFICYAAMAVVSYVWGQKHYPVPYNVRRVLGYMAAAHFSGWKPMARPDWLAAGAVYLLVAWPGLCRSYVFHTLHRVVAEDPEARAQLAAAGVEGFALRSSTKGR